MIIVSAITKQKTLPKKTDEVYVTSMYGSALHITLKVVEYSCRAAYWAAVGTSPTYTALHRAWLASPELVMAVMRSSPGSIRTTCRWFYKLFKDDEDIDTTTNTPSVSLIIENIRYK